MSQDQVVVLGILAGALVLFASNRLRYDLVALGALLAAVVAGIVPPENAFAGFGDPVVVTVAAVLVISRALRSSGLLERLIRPLEPAMRSTSAQVAILTAAVAALSAFMNNVGALAVALPVAVQLARRRGRPPSLILMPLAFGSLLGGLVTLIGTPPNLLVSAVRRDVVGRGFEMFDFTPVGLTLTAAGVAFLAFAWRLLPRDRQGQPDPEDLFRVEDYVSEAVVPEGSSTDGRTVAGLERMADGDVTVSALVREGFRRYVPAGDWTLHAGDVLVLQGDPHALKRLMDGADLRLAEASPPESAPSFEDEIGFVEAVVMGGSPVIGCTLAELNLRERFGINLLAVGRRGTRITVRLRRVRIQAGDMLVLQGRLRTMPDKLAALGCLPLAQRHVRLGEPRRSLAAAVVLASAVGLSVLELVPIAIAFAGAVLAIALLRLLPLSELYESVAWPVVVLIGALIPVSEAVRTTGVTDLLAGELAALAAGLPPMGSLALVLLATMLVTPVLNNAATVLVMAPVAASLAVRLGLQIDPFLMAVAVGASCDFLTPIGHQSNTLVMGPGGYRFGDYWRLGLPLSVMVVALGTPAIAWVWPLR